MPRDGEDLKADYEKEVHSLKHQLKKTVNGGHAAPETVPPARLQVCVASVNHILARVFKFIATRIKAKSKKRGLVPYLPPFLQPPS